MAGVSAALDFEGGNHYADTRAGEGIGAESSRERDCSGDDQHAWGSAGMGSELHPVRALEAVRAAGGNCRRGRLSDYGGIRYRAGFSGGWGKDAVGARAARSRRYRAKGEVVEDSALRQRVWWLEHPWVARGP